MAETFKVGANARELLRYTQRATRIVTDDISRSDARKIIQKVAALEDVRDIQKVCGTAVHQEEIAVHSPGCSGAHGQLRP